MRLRHTLLVLILLTSSCAGEQAASPPRRSRSAPPVSAGQPSAAATVTPPVRRVAPKTLAVLDAGLASQDYAVRLLATEALGCVAPGDAIARLEVRLADAEADVVAAAIGSLHRQPGARARALLSSVCDDDEEDMALRVLAAAALVTPPPSCKRTYP